MWTIGAWRVEVVRQGQGWTWNVIENRRHEWMIKGGCTTREGALESALTCLHLLDCDQWRDRYVITCEQREMVLMLSPYTSVRAVVVNALGQIGQTDTKGWCLKSSAGTLPDFAAIGTVREIQPLFLVKS